MHFICVIPAAFLAYSSFSRNSGAGGGGLKARRQKTGQKAGRIFSPFLGLHLQHMEVPRLGGKSELHLGLCLSHSNSGSELHL